MSALGLDQHFGKWKCISSDGAEDFLQAMGVEKTKRDVNLDIQRKNEIFIKKTSFLGDSFYTLK